MSLRPCVLLGYRTALHRFRPHDSGWVRETAHAAALPRRCHTEPALCKPSASANGDRRHPPARRTTACFAKRAWALLALCTTALIPAQGQNELHIAAASDLQPVLPALATAYQHATGTHVVPTFGSSATLTQQIQNGAPADLFLSADCVHPQQLVDAHLASGPRPTPYATGVLVLWARKDSPAQPLSLDSLTSAKVARIAVANDLHAPYGQAATAELRALHLDQTLKPKLVTGENIMQTAQFADTGNAQAALISLTIASSPHFRETGSFIPLPRHYPPIQQCGVVLARGEQQPAAQSFLNWLTTSATQARLKSYGLDPAR